MNVLASAAALLLACSGFVTYDFLTIRQSLVGNLSTQAQVFGSSNVAALLFNDRESAEKSLGALRSAPDVVSAGLYTSDGRLFAVYRRDAGSQVPESAELLASQQEKHWFARRDMMLMDRIVFQGQSTGFIFMESDLEAFRARMKRYLLISLCVLLGSMAIAVSVSTSFRGAILSPIRELAEVARVVSQERNYAVRADGQKTPAELRMLVEAFNDMLAQIEQRDRELLQARDELERRVEQRTAELEAANKELESFSYSVSHDLRAPLRSIDGFSLALLQDYAAIWDPEAKAYFERIRAATRRMGVLIDDLLNLARVTRAELRRERVNLSAMAISVAADLRKADQARKVDTFIQQNMEAVGDPRLLRVVLDNLLGNAWKYTSKHDSARIEFGQMHSNGSCIYFVRDDGAGFDPAYAGKLFGAFQRLHATSDFPGTGVGLATVQRIVHRHGGKIWAESEVGKGATFYFTV